MPDARRPIEFHFRERMAGFVSAEIDDPQRAAERGRAAGTRFVADLRVIIDDLAACMRDPQHAAQLRGTVTFPGLATAQPVHDGRLLLYVADPNSGTKLMRYRFAFDSDAGDRYFLDGSKVLHTPGASTREQITLYTRIHAGGPDGAVWGAGILIFRLRDVPAFLLSMQAVGASRVSALRMFFGFARRELATPVITPPAPAA
jgi:hypothetical protein